ncbi:MAG: hypothetical protein ACYTGR_15770, partial [Planctomycetota bacterium]
MNLPTALQPVVLAAALACTAALVHAQSDPAAAQAREEIGQQLEELATTLRAAVMSGSLEGDVGRRIYGRVAGAAKAAYARDFEDGKGDATGPGEPSAKGNVSRLRAPRPGRLHVL